MPLTRQKDRDCQLRIGLTEKHGMAVELTKCPPSGVEYSFLNPLSSKSRLIRSPIKGYFRRYETEEHDLVEAVLSPVSTKNKWIYQLANFHEAVAFNFLGCPLPRSIRIGYIKSIMLKDNFKKLIFWSQAGKETLNSYHGVHSENFLNKVTVVYPAIREVPDHLVRFNDGDVHILFSGDFFRKGGVNVIDAFERAQKSFPKIKLILCCDEKIDFNTPNTTLKNEYLTKIKSNSGIIALGRVSRDEIINNILPRTDIYLLPTYVEAFGFALLEAMAYGIPVISTNYFAIPEMVEHDVCGYLIDTSKFDCDRLFNGYVVNEIPVDFRDHVTDKLFEYLCPLIKSVALRERLGKAGSNIVKKKFSFEERNNKMLQIYKEAI